MKEGRKPEYLEKTPGDELQKMPHTKTRRFKPQAKPESAQKHWWLARKADVLTVTPRVAPHVLTVTPRVAPQVLTVTPRVAPQVLTVTPRVCRSCRSNLLPHPVTVYRLRANPSTRSRSSTRRLAGKPP